MMYNTLSELFKGICDAIREKTGDSGVIQHQEIPEKISTIEGQGEGALQLFEPEYLTDLLTVVDAEDIIKVEEETV